MSDSEQKKAIRVAVTEDQEIIFGAIDRTWIGTLVEVRKDDFLVAIPKNTVLPSAGGVVQRVREDDKR